MVLCDGGFLLSTSVSIVMNGVCACYQMHGEKELRQAMRSDIREEWKQQRAEEARAERAEEARAKKVDSERRRLRSMKRRHRLLNATTSRLRPTQLLEPYTSRPMDATSSWEQASGSGVTQRMQTNYHNMYSHSYQKQYFENQGTGTISTPCLLDEEHDEDTNEENFFL